MKENFTKHKNTSFLCRIMPIYELYKEKSLRNFGEQNHKSYPHYAVHELSLIQFNTIQNKVCTFSLV